MKGNHLAEVISKDLVQNLNLEKENKVFMTAMKEILQNLRIKNLVKNHLGHEEILISSNF